MRRKKSHNIPLILSNMRRVRHTFSGQSICWHASKDARVDHGSVHAAIKGGQLVHKLCHPGHVERRRSGGFRLRIACSQGSSFSSFSCSVQFACMSFEALVQAEMLELMELVGRTHSW